MLFLGWGGLSVYGRRPDWISEVVNGSCRAVGFHTCKQLESQHFHPMAAIASMIRRGPECFVSFRSRQLHTMQKPIVDSV